MASKPKLERVLRNSLGIAGVGVGSRAAAEADSLASPRALSGAVVGQLLPGSAPGRLRVDFPGNTKGPLEARTVLQLSFESIEQAVASSQGALLTFDAGDESLPIVVGLVQAPEPSPFEALLAGPRDQRLNLVKRPTEARLDGERVVLEATREIVLRCGEASLTLRRDGRVSIRGAYVETHSTGVNRIKGASVKIN